MFRWVFDHMVKQKTKPEESYSYKQKDKKYLDLIVPRNTAITSILIRNI